MRCSICILQEEANSPLSLAEFHDRLLGCDDCPSPERAAATVRLLTQRHRQSAILIRQLQSKVRQREGELAELRKEGQKAEQRLLDIEQIHKRNTLELEARHQESTDALERQMATVLRQAEDIHALSAPLIEVATDVVVMPLIGALDAQRLSAVMERLLCDIQSQGRRAVVIDLTGLAEVTGDTGPLLLRLFNSIRLLGARFIVSGVTPRIAALLVQLGTDLSEIKAVRTVKAALKTLL